MKQLLTLALVLIAAGTVAQDRFINGVNQTSYWTVDTTVNIDRLLLAVNYILMQRNWNEKAHKYLDSLQLTGDDKYSYLCQKAIDSSTYYDKKYKTLKIK
jgi:hypothetical protein